MSEEPLDRDFEKEEDLLSFVEERVKQLNLELNDLEKSQFSEQKEEFAKHTEKIEKEIYQLREIVQKNYIRLAGGEDKIANWVDIDMYASTVTLMERLTEIRDTNTVGV